MLIYHVYTKFIMTYYVCSFSKTYRIHLWHNNFLFFLIIKLFI